MKISGKQFLVIGAFLAGLGVALGAVASHALKDFLIGNNRTETFEIAVRYQLYHGLALIMVGILCYVVTEVNFFVSGMLLLMGVILFSGSLYALSLTALRWVVYLTPVGGMLMISGWLILIIRLIKSVK